MRHALCSVMSLLSTGLAFAGVEPKGVYGNEAGCAAAPSGSMPDSAIRVDFDNGHFFEGRVGDCDIRHAEMTPEQDYFTFFGFCVPQQPTLANTYAMSSDASDKEVYQLYWGQDAIGSVRVCR